MIRKRWDKIRRNGNVQGKEEVVAQFQGVTLPDLSKPLVRAEGNTFTIVKKEKTMNKHAGRTLALSLMLVIVSSLGSAVWAFKNVCQDCHTLIEDMNLTACPECGRLINKCLNCGEVNPAKNDNCSKCNASLAESRVSRTIEKEIRDDLRLGESPRAKIEVELAQIEHEIAMDGLSEKLAARQVELMTKMKWWSMANTLANQFGIQYPDSDKADQVKSWRVISLRQLGFLALEAKKMDKAREYLQTALSLDPKDAKSQNLLKMAGEAK